MAGISVIADGDLLIQQIGDGTGCNPVGADQLAFPIALFAAGLTGISGTDGSEISQQSFSVNSSGAFVALAFPSTLRARVFFLRALPGSGPLDVRLTHAVAGATVYPDQYLMLLQFDAVEQITLAEVRGVGSFAWAAVGVLV